MTRARRARALSAMVAGVLVAITGCSKQAAPETVQAVLVIAARANMPALLNDDGSPAAKPLSDAIDQIAQCTGSVQVVRSDGAPEKAGGAIKLTIDTTSSTTRDDSLYANRNAIADVLKNQVAATAGEADPITALDEVARIRASGPIDVFDNGLATAGSLLMQTGLITQGGDVSKLVKQLEQQQVIGSFKGMHITWYGLGEVAPPQGRVPAWAITQLETLYTSLIKDAGGTVEFRPLSASGGKAVTTPEVSVVPFPVTSVSASASTKPPELPITRVLDESQLDFISDSTEFKDAAQAKATLRNVAMQLEEGGYGNVRVYGCTARPPGSSDASLTAFGLKRAQRVVAELKTLGVSSKLTPASFGWACPGYIADSDSAGNFVEQWAAKNRRVIITNQQLQSVK